MEKILDPEVGRGIDIFLREMSRLWPGVEWVIPQRPSAGRFLVSASCGAGREYFSIAEDDFLELADNVEFIVSLQKKIVAHLERLPAPA